MIAKTILLVNRIVAGLMPLFAVIATTAQPAYINYQGRLNDAVGQPLPTGAYTIEFNIYNDPTGNDVTNRVWGPFVFDGAVADGHGASASVINGRFNVILGPVDTSGRSIRDAFDDENRFLEIKVNNGAPILPRQQFLSTPYAFKARGIAGNLDIVGDAGVSSNLTVGKDLRISGTVQGGLNIQGSLGVSGEITSTANGASFYMVPKGAIIMWAGSVASIPSGWALCDGSNGTPDLRNRFVLGYDPSGAIGLTGGTNRHNHTVDIGAFSSSVGIGTSATGSGGGNNFGTHHHSIDPPSTATSTATFLPPYMMLAYIIKL
jgi:hypothetical protein